MLLFWVLIRGHARGDLEFSWDGFYEVVGGMLDDFVHLLWFLYAV